MAQTSLHKGFCIDTSALIEMTNYPQDIFSGLWLDLGSIADEGLLISPREVFVEIGKKWEEDLQKWVKLHSNMFVKLDEDQFLMAQNIITKFPKLVKINKTIPDADPFVIALAKSRGSWVVVTSENSSKNKFVPKIPDVCKSLNVKYIDLHNLLRECNFKYPRTTHI
jgi:hypothetical protein